MKLAVISLFRNNAADVKRVFAERARWPADFKDTLHVCIEGDSTDDTFAELTKISGFNTIVEKIDQGTPHWGSVAEPSRLEALAKLWNRAFDLAVVHKPHFILLVDSDITVGPEVLPRLMAHDKDAIAPMLYFENSVFFRDAWAYHQGGDDFLNRFPYHKCYLNNKLFEVDGVGCPLIKYEVIARGARCDGQEVRGLCASIKRLGYKIFVDPKAAVYHPRLGQQIPPNHERAR